MKILEVIPNLSSGGAENFVVSLSNQFVENPDCKVTLLTLYKPQSEEFLRNRLHPQIKLITLQKKDGFDFLLAYKIYKLIKSERFDIVHFHVQAIIYAIYSVLFYRKCKYFATIHSDAYKEAVGLHRFIRYFMFKCYLMHAITISKVSQESFEKLYNVDSTLIYNGVKSYKETFHVDLSKYKKDSKTIIIINVGSLIPLKNQIAFAKAINHLVIDGENVVGLVLGKKSRNNEDYYIELSNYQNENFKILGEVENPVDYLVSSDFFTLVSLYEGMPISLLEAISVGCVPIVTPVGGIVDVISDGINGIVAKGTSEQDIYEAMKRALSLEKKTIDELRNHLVREFNNYTINRCADLYLNLFKSTKK